MKFEEIEVFMNFFYYLQSFRGFLFLLLKKIYVCIDLNSEKDLIIIRLQIFMHLWEI